MKNLFDKWKEKIPKYDIVFRELLFDKLTKKGGGSEQSKEDRGKQFSNNYELYIYAFFLGLYNKEYSPIPENSKKVDFNHAIQFWGSKTNVLYRRDFTNLQENMFMAIVAKTDIDLVALEKGELDEDDAVKLLIRTMESYTNGGLILIKEKLEENPNYFLQPTSFLNMILDSNYNEDYSSKIFNSNKKENKIDSENNLELEIKKNNKIMLEHNDHKNTKTNQENNSNDPLIKFLIAQNTDYKKALNEIKFGRKKTHWMWYIFPQIKGLGTSEMSQKYAINSLEEAKMYLNHDILGKRLREISKALIKLDVSNIDEVLPFPDNLKLLSCMTLFIFTEANTDNEFRAVINKYFDGKIDKVTVELIKGSRKII